VRRSEAVRRERQPQAQVWRSDARDHVVPMNMLWSPSPESVVHGARARPPARRTDRRHVLPMAV